MKPARLVALGMWLLLLTASAVLIEHAHYSADLSAFLPRSPSPLQQLLVQQLRTGPSARLILIGIEGADAATRASLSRALAQSLRAESAFTLIANGEAGSSEREQQLLFAHRYQLSPAVTAGRFSVAGLHAAIADSIDLLASPAGMLAQQLFAADPTGETLQAIDQFQSASQPRLEQGVWSSRDRNRALLIAQTRAEGADTDAQEQAVALIRAAFARTKAALPRAQASQPALSLLLSGPGFLSVQARATIKHEALRLSLLSTGLIVTLLLAVYRSLPALLLGMAPVVSGALAGVAAVSVGFGVVFGLTLGFGITLTGESVDYPIYYLIQARSGDASSDTAAATAGSNAPQAHARAVLWSIIGLGALTSICGFASLLSSQFAGLAQLGLYSVSGLVVAAAVTRWVLPALLPIGVRIPDLSPLGSILTRWLRSVRLPLIPALALALACIAIIAYYHQRLWDRSLSALSPLPTVTQTLDAQLRTDLGAPDVSNLVIVNAASEEAALESVESVAQRLDQLAAQNLIAGYDSPARYLPSLAAQQTRLASLPDAPTLRAHLAAALSGLPVSSSTLDPFLMAVEAARHAAPVTRATLGDSSLGLAVDGLLWHEGEQWRAMLPLHAPASGGDIDLMKVRAAVADLAPRGVVAFNLKQETDRLYDEYLSAATRQSALGLAAIVLLLALSLRDARRVLLVLAPLMLSVLVVGASFALGGGGLTIMHLIGLLLIVAIGSNYALFFDRNAAEADPALLPRTLASLLVANTSTVMAFGVLATSSVPVLNALGRTVAPGALLALLFAALLAPRKLFGGSPFVAAAAGKSLEP
jgi:predicted exporter